MSVEDWAKQRRRMVEMQLRRRGIRDARVLDVMERIPREMFIAEAQRPFAYDDAPVGIGFGQTISQPYMTAFMCEALDLKGTEVVLDVGTGSGYHAAVLAALARRVYSIELIPELAEQARQNLRAAGLDGNVSVIQGDGSKGYAEAMPYDAISVAAAAPEIPGPLMDQLADPGRLVIPVGSLGEQDLLLFSKRADHTSTRRIAMCRFVPLRGEQGWPGEE
jgi:protein-L-isoaspartate(D-aspartate) O-methyltransferase